MKPMMLYLALAYSSERRYAADSAIDGIAVEVCQPVRDFEGEIVQKGRGQEHHCRPDGEDYREQEVMRCEKKREDPGPARNLGEVSRVRGAEIRSMEDPMVLYVVAPDVTKERQPSMHREAMHRVLEEIGVESARHEPEYEYRLER
jgi:hypothetical protein